MPTIRTHGRPRLRAFRGEPPLYEDVAPLDVAVFEERQHWPRSPRQALKDRELPRYTWTWRPGTPRVHIYDSIRMGVREPCVIDVADFAGAIAGARWATDKKPNGVTARTRACPTHDRWLYSADIAWFGGTVIGHAKLDIDYLQLAGSGEAVLIALDPRLIAFHMKERHLWRHEGLMLLEVVRALRGRP